MPSFCRPRWRVRWPATRGLALASPTPPAEVVSRAEWAAVNLDTLSHILDPVAARLDDRLGFAGPLAGALRAAAAATLAAEAGLVMGYLSSRVLGQYDVSLLGAETEPRLLFVDANLSGAVRDLDVDADSFGRWICAHELTHVFQFQGVPWLREHMSGLLHRYVETLEVRIDSGSAGRVAVAAGSFADCRGFPRGWARCACAESRTAGIDG